jgi:surfeit locus 1 family protein
MTLAVLAVAVGMIRLGFWQLDRLQQRRAINASIMGQMSAPTFDLNLMSLPANLTNMEYRSIKVSGVYDFSQQIYLKNQVWQNQLGVHLLTPLRISGINQAILVDRGWVPFQDATPEKIDQFDIPGQVTVNGIILLSQSEPGFGRISDPQLSSDQLRLQSWVVVNLDRIQKQVDFSILPVYIQQTPDNISNHLPYRVISSPDLSEGPHLSYAVQWFSFSGILLICYGILTRRQFRMEKKGVIEGNQ